MVFWTLTLLCILCYTLYYYCKKQSSIFEEHGIPFLPGWPVVGNMGSVVMLRKHFIDTVQDMYDCNSDAKYVGAFNFTNPIIVLRDPELIKSITIKNFDHFQDHRGFFDTNYDPLMSGNLLNLKGNQWRETRNLLSPSFTSKKIKAMYEPMYDCTKRVINFIEELSEEGKKALDTKDLFTRYTMDVIAACAYGLTVDSLKNPDNQFYVFGRKVTDSNFIQTMKFFFITAFPKLSALLKIKFVSDDVAMFFKKIIHETVSARDEKGIQREDMLGLMMNARDKDHEFIKVDITNMTAQAFIFFFGGFETTSTQICMIAHQLAANPEIQKNLHAEIDRVLIETKGNPTYDVINTMPYFDAIFNETMRINTQGFVLDRMCTKDIEIPPALPGGKPFTIKRGMNVWIPAGSIHLDPQYYNNPQKFDPQRFYEKKISVNDVTSLGFGIGPRSCIGNRFAIFEIKILLFYLLSKYTFKPNPKTSTPLKYVKGSFSIKVEGGFWLSVEPRIKNQ